MQRFSLRQAFLYTSVSLRFYVQRRFGANNFPIIRNTFKIIF